MSKWSDIGIVDPDIYFPKPEGIEEAYRKVFHKNDVARKLWLGFNPDKHDPEKYHLDNVILNNEIRIALELGIVDDNWITERYNSFVEKVKLWESLRKNAK